MRQIGPALCCAAGTHPLAAAAPASAQTLAGLLPWRCAGRTHGAHCCTSAQHTALQVSARFVGAGHETNMVHQESSCLHQVADVSHFLWCAAKLARGFISGIHSCLETRGHRQMLTKTPNRRLLLHQTACLFKPSLFTDSASRLSWPSLRRSCPPDQICTHTVDTMTR